MTIREKFALVIAVLLLIASGIALYGWMQEHDARIRAESVDAAQGKVIADAQKAIDTAKVEQAQTAVQLQQRLNVLEAQKQQTVTAPQFVVDLNKLIPSLPQPVKIVSQPSQPGKPDAPAAVEIPIADLQALKQYRIGCDETSAKLDACSVTSGLQEQQSEGLQAQLKAAEVERDSWKTAAKGGSKWHRIGAAAKWIAIGAAAGYVAERSGR